MSSSSLESPPPYNDESDSIHRPLRHHQRLKPPSGEQKEQISLCSAIVLFGFLIWAIVALIVDHDARHDTECGSIYEFCILATVVFGVTILTEVLRLCHRFDPMLDLFEILGHLALIIWSFYVWGQKLSSDCRQHYESTFPTLYWFYYVNFFLYAIYVGIIGVFFVLCVIVFSYNAFVDHCL